MSEQQASGFSRRQAIVAAGIAGAATLAGLPSLGGGEAESAEGEPREAPAEGRLPVVYLPHGGGPWPFADLGMGQDEVEGLLGYLRSLKSLSKAKPKALLVVSAHWEAAVPTLMTSERPPMFYDYYGFPPSTYELVWPAPGDPTLATRVSGLLEGAGFTTATNATRGFDHGTFVPMMVAFPEADVPTVQLSLKLGLDPVEHIEIGKALAPLRDEGVLIVGSGMSYHNMRGFRDPKARPVAEAFDAWLGETMGLEAKARDERLAGWASAPQARQAHPREEHLLPLMVVAGAAGADRGRTGYRGTTWGIRISAFEFG